MITLAVPPSHAPCGWFGKMACLGDFTSRRLPESFVALCDEWLSRGLAASRIQLGDDWLQTYLQAPLWRFAWAPGVAGPEWWLGVLMPSVDRVGRYFPLIAARASAGLPSTPQGLAALQAWFDAIADATLATLGPGTTPDDFDSRLEAVPDFDGSADADAPAWRGVNGRRCLVSEHELDLAAWALAATAPDWNAALRGHSLWLAGRADAGGGASLSIARGLPEADDFVQLLGGRW